MGGAGSVGRAAPAPASEGPKRAAHYASVARRLAELQQPIRILRAVAWPDSVQQEFFTRRAEVLPRPIYRVQRDFQPIISELCRLRTGLSTEDPVDRLLDETCQSWIDGARLLSAIGTREFYARSVECYGRPASISCDGRSTNLLLAEHFDRVLRTYAGADLGAPPSRVLPAERVAELLDERLRQIFRGHSVRCEVANTLSAKAVTSAEVIKIKRGEVFTEREVEQILVHEGEVHLATTLNGREQPILSTLAHGAPRTARTQEGLAIFTEFISQNIDLDRLRRLTDRILGIRMAEEGADFIDLFRFFLERGNSEPTAFDCAQRVVRGGVVTGGAPFTKDVIYLDGLVRIAHFLRVVISCGRADLVRLMFCGKLALEDLPLLAHLEAGGLVCGPSYLPGWASDLRFVTAYMSLNAFLARNDLDATEAYYRSLVESAGGSSSIVESPAGRSNQNQVRPSS